MIRWIRVKIATTICDRITYRFAVKKEPMTQEMATAWNNLQGVIITGGTKKLPNMRTKVWPAFKWNSKK